MREFLFRAFTFLKLSDVTADAADHFEQLFIRLANLLAEKLDHADYFIAETNRKAKRSAQSGAFSERAKRKVGILFQIGPYAERAGRSEEHTSELQSLAYLVCRLLLEKKKKL